MGKITSLKNERVRRVLALQRSTRRRLHAGLFVAEGLRLVREVVNSGLSVSAGYYTEAFSEDMSAQVLLADLAQRTSSLWEVSSDVMSAMSDTETPQGILVELPIPTLPAVPKGNTFILVPDGIRDPGNLGTMLRTAWAVGISQVFLPPGTVDFTNPKVVRAGMGAHFYVPMRRVDWTDIASVLGDTDVWIADAGLGTSYDAVDWNSAVSLIVGSEAAGPSQAARSLKNARYVHIPMALGVDSLNAAVATAVILFEAAKRRRRA